MSAQAAAVLRDAARVIDERGHAKDALCDQSGAVCMWGGINAAMSGDAESHVADIIDTAKLFRPIEEAVTDIAEYDRRNTVKFELLHEMRKRFPEDDDTIYPGAFALNDLPETTGQDVQKFLLQTADEIEFV